MILVGLGSNLSTSRGGPKEILLFALSLFAEYGIPVLRLSSFYETEPVGPTDQPSFINAVVQVDWKGDAPTLMSSLHAIEDRLGRQRANRWHARTLDLDLLDFKHMVVPDKKAWRAAGLTMLPPETLILPHPRMHERLFVLEPLQEVAPDWVHPCLHQTAKTLADGIKGQTLHRIVP